MENSTEENDQSISEPIKESTYKNYSLKRDGDYVFYLTMRMDEIEPDDQDFCLLRLNDQFTGNPTPVRMELNRRQFDDLLALLTMIKEAHCND